MRISLYFDLFVALWLAFGDLDTPLERRLVCG
jgi:hypothetical protein